MPTKEPADWEQTEIQFLKGIGPKRAELFHKLDIYTLRDLVYHFPRSYLNVGQITPIAAAMPGESCSVLARVVEKSREQRIRKGLSVFKVKVTDDSGVMLLTFFNNKFAVDALKLEESYYFYGKVGGNLLRKEMTSPLIFSQQEGAGMVPVYPLTTGLTSRMISAGVEQAFTHFPQNLPDFLPGELRLENKLCTLEYALRTIHFPKSAETAETAKQRLIFDEFLILSIGLGLVKGEKAKAAGRPMKQVPVEPFYQALPFTPTNAQQRCVTEACRDLCRSTPMNRLVQGDVGSGKTLVAAACCYFAWKNGLQTAVMAPTEILANQHYETFSGFLAPFGVRVGLLTASLPAPQKRQVLAKLQSGELDLCIGTHALLSEGVNFANLGLVITDEQHRFGVAQRVQLAQKGESPHMLVMSATPIPRTLALMIYGDLELSVIDELPPNRQPVKTYRIGPDKRDRAFGFLRQHLDKGLQCYIVCPLIEQGEADMGLKPAVQYAQELANTAFKGYRVGLLHGRMKPQEKDQVMASFQSGEIQLLVSTTVIEVGVDVPNAVVMLIENAERFGLSQLHQLRGRVGRGREQSSCILLSGAKNPETTERLKVLCSTNDGFKVAEYDLKMRGPGDFLGYRQHGLPQLAIADMARDVDLLSAAQQTARRILNQDPRLEHPEHQGLKERVSRILERVGEQMN